MKWLGIKWEEIIGILLVILDITMLIIHLIKYDFVFELFCIEIIVYALTFSTIYLTTLSLRRNLIEIRRNK